MQIETLRRRLRQLQAGPAHEQRVLRLWTLALPQICGRRRLVDFTSGRQEGGSNDPLGNVPQSCTDGPKKGRRSAQFNRCGVRSGACAASVALGLGAVLATCLSALAAGFSRFFRTELMRGAFFVRSAAALAGDFTLACRVHRCEATI